MTHFTESKGEYVGSQWYSVFSGNTLPDGHILPTDKYSHGKYRKRNNPLLSSTWKEKLTV